jgi:putative membrane protein
VEHQPDPRFLLANERTFLAWMRTALAVGAAAVAIAGLAPDTDPLWVRASISLGLALLAVGLLAWAVRRYREADAALRAGHAMPRLRGAPVMAGGLAVLLVVAVVALLLATPR